MPAFETTLTPKLIQKFTDMGLWGDKIITDYLDMAAERHPDKAAIIDPQGQYTFAELRRLVNRVAFALLEQGIRPGDVISFQLPNWTEFVILYYAATRIGAISNPLIPIYREREIRYMVNAVQSKILVIPDHFNKFDYTEMVQRLRPEFPSVERVYVVGKHVPEGMELFSTLTEHPWEKGRSRVELLQYRPSANAVSEAIFTSGTTAQPKGVLHTQNTLLAPIRALTRRQGLNENDVIHMASTFGHQTGFLYGVMLPTLLGATAVYQDVWNVQRFVEMVERYRITMTAGATPFLVDFLGSPHLQDHDVSSLRLFSCMGAPIPRVMLRQARERLPNCKVLGGWGQTENGMVTFGRPTDPEEKICGTDGCPLDGMEVRVVDADGNPVPAGQEGRVQVRGAFLFVGYLNQPALTRESYDGDWFNTGDRAVMDADGYISITGRDKDIIIRGGENIPVAYVENVLHESPKIAAAAVVAMPDPRLQERACAFVVLRDGVNLTFREMQDFLQAKGVAKSYWPERLEIVPALPRTPSGKIQKYKLRDEIARKLEEELRSQGG